ncbi:Flp family type IVb pilin [Nitratireductor sp. GCM10026969]|uniref:Flp family type IVb pilin n=1 Tax=Nitratireductor sp. GCM10026969 TaxID=3252645 RepID=UPI0036191E4F
MSKLIARFKNDESGATAIEYGLLAALIAVAVIAGASLLGEGIEDSFEELGNNLKAHTEKTAPAD